jgi:hypothetical protein
MQNELSDADGYHFAAVADLIFFRIIVSSPEYSESQSSPSPFSEYIGSVASLKISYRKKQSQHQVK